MSGATLGSTKSSPIRSKASPTSALDLFIMQGIINASLRKSTCQKCLSYQTRWKQNFAEKNIIFGIPTVEHFLNVLTDSSIKDYLTVLWSLQKVQ